jgi:hypothetical protein
VTGLQHPVWCDPGLCTAAAGDAGQARASHYSTTRRIEVPDVADLPVIELFLQLPYWEPITATPTIWLRLTRTDVAESVERYDLAADQLRALAAAAGELRALIDTATKPAPAGPSCPECGAVDYWRPGATEQVCPTCGHTATGAEVDAEFTRWLDDGEVSS